MPVQYLPVIEKIATTLGPILINELSKPRTRKILENVIGQTAEFAFKAGKRRLLKKQPRGSTNFIMRRGRNRFQCRKVN